MEHLGGLLLWIVLLLIGLTAAFLLPSLAVVCLFLAAYQLAFHLVWPLSALYLLWWLLLHGRRRDGRWEAMGQFRYAHRGLHGPGVPENSLAAFRLAVQRGYGAELDVRLTRDGRLAVIHDSSLCRTCGAEGRVESCTAEELSAFRLEGTQEPIPFLEEVAPLFAGSAPLIVELKPENGNHAALTAAAADCLHRCGGTFCLESFDPRALLFLRRHRPQLLRGQLSQNFWKDPAGLPRPLRFVLTNLLCNAFTRPDFIAYRFEDRRNPSRFLCCRRWGTQAAYWTIRTPSDLAAAEREHALVIFESFDPNMEVFS